MEALSVFPLVISLVLSRKLSLL